MLKTVALSLNYLKSVDKGSSLAQSIKFREITALLETS